MGEIEYTTSFQENSFDSFYSTVASSQEGYTFKVTSSTKGTSIIKGFKTTVSQIIEGTFSCKTYKDNNPSESLELKDGKFRIELFSFYNKPLTLQ